LSQFHEKDQEDIKEVKRIKDDKLEDGEKSFLVEWKDGDELWEKEANFIDVDCIRKYFKNRIDRNTGTRRGPGRPREQRQQKGS
jgi:hypothetical protein